MGGWFIQKIISLYLKIKMEGIFRQVRVWQKQCNKTCKQQITFLYPNGITIIYATCIFWRENKCFGAKNKNLSQITLYLEYQNYSPPLKTQGLHRLKEKSHDSDCCLKQFSFFFLLTKYKLLSRKLGHLGTIRTRDPRPALIFVAVKWQ